MKKPLLAFTLSFLLPGAGLAYLGKWRWAFLNLLLVLAVGLFLAIILSEETFDRYIRVVAMGCSGGSGGVAHTLATQMKQKDFNSKEES